MPLADGFGNGGVAHKHGVHGGAKETFDEQRRRLVSGDEVAQRAENGALAEAVALLQETGGAGRKSDALALETFQCIDLALQCDMGLVGTEQFSARGALAFAGLTVARLSGFELGVRDGEPRDGVHGCLGCLVALAPNERECIGQLSALDIEGFDALHDFIELAPSALALVLHAMRAVVGVAQVLLGLVDSDAGAGDATPGYLFLVLPELQFLARTGERALVSRALGGSLLAVVGDALPVCVSLACLGFGALPPGDGVALTFLGDGHLGANLQDVLALGDDEPEKLGALAFGRGAPTMGLVARALGGIDTAFDVRQRLAKLTDPRLESRQFLSPGLHFSRREVELHRKATTHELRMTLGALALSGERTHLRLHFADEVVEPL